ncbi:GDSL-type esterase/lipase family protein [Shivajiella indica]|uniref:GDSL-type esterase/lipase family protein n=1 Tax=Shivajiella indica TaxID=872115 RepID=A0ABW5B9Y4_9BACT
MNPFFKTSAILIFLLVFSYSPEIKAQTQPFENEVKELVKKYETSPWNKGGAVFTGSSSIRLWKTLEEDFPQANIINTGFGGSQTHDLIRYLDELVISFEPKKVFIYVGENDINAGKTVRQIINEYGIIIDRVSTSIPEVGFYFIGTKPSPSRWDKKGQMEALNNEMQVLSKSKENVTYIDVWTKMLNKNGTPNEKLFVDDRLHMNSKGYKIWKKAVKPYLE